MRIVIPAINGVVGGAGAWAYLNAQTWAGQMFIVGLAGAIILYGESIRRTLGEDEW